LLISENTTDTKTQGTESCRETAWN